MKTEREKLDPIVFAVIKARLDGLIGEMVETVLRTARSPLLYSAKDFTCSILTYDAKLLTMADSLPMHLLGMARPLKAIVECFWDDIHPGDCFVNNDPYYGNNHVGDWVMFAPVFYEGELVCWAGTLCHLIDVGAYIPASIDPLAKDVYEEALHFPPLRMGKDYKEIPEIIRFIKANFRYPDQWHGDFLTQIGSLFKGEQGIIKLCKKYGGDVFKQFEDDYLDYGDCRMTEEIRRLPRGTWSIEALTDKMEPLAPEGLLLKLKMSIDPDEAVITYDLTEMPDQLPWGYNLSETCCRGACIEGSMPSLDPTLPRNDGAYRHFNFVLREGAVAGIPKYPASTSTATTSIADAVCNMVLLLWDQVELGRGHAANGQQGASNTFTSGTDFRRDDAAYGQMYFLATNGGGASKGCDGWPPFNINAVMGNMYLESIELVELKSPVLIWEVGIQTDRGGAGKWRGAPGTYHIMQPRHHTFMGITYGMGRTTRALGAAGGKGGSLSEHWIEKHDTQEEVQNVPVSGVFWVAEDEDEVVYSCGGGGYGDPLERDPEAVRNDARNYIISVEAARDEYGVVLNTVPELYEVDYEATGKLRAQLKEEKGGK